MSDSCGLLESHLVSSLRPARETLPARASTGRYLVMEILLALGGAAALIALLTTQSKPLPTKEEAEKAFAVLDKDPMNPDANTIFGKWKAFVQGDYDGAMPYLVHSKDATLKALAEKELDEANTATPQQKISMGDEWVNGAKKIPALFRAFYDRAGYWYSKAWPDLDLVGRQKLRAVAAKLSASRPPGPAAKKALPAADFSNEGLPGAKPSDLDGTIARTGSYSLKMYPADPKVKDSVSRFRSTRMVVPPGGKTLEISAWVRSDGTENGADRMFMFYVDQTGTGIGTIGPFLPIDMPFWTRVYQKVDQIPPNVVRLDYGASMSSKMGNIWIDDMSVKVDGKEILKNGSFEN